jgi:hypothetical protein
MDLDVHAGRSFGAGADFEVFIDEAARRGGLGHGVLL